MQVFQNFIINISILQIIFSYPLCYFSPLIFVYFHVIAEGGIWTLEGAKPQDILFFANTKTDKDLKSCTLGQTSLPLLPIDKCDWLFITKHSFHAEAFSFVFCPTSSSFAFSICLYDTSSNFLSFFSYNNYIFTPFIFWHQ